ncbi:MAG TPA: alkaline phosphatase family protein [Candidatus Angelobacter sp.]|nr:alkaline phosphatase family protein [Candidatus Angelobacter sp.]
MTTLDKTVRVASLAVWAICIVALLSGCQGVSTATSSSATMQGKVNHIIFIMQENRSFDSYFGKLNDYRAGTFNAPRSADDLESVFTNPADDGSTVGNFHLTTTCIEDDSAAWEESWGDMNRFNSPNGPLLLDGFVHTGSGFAVSNSLSDTKGVRAMGFYNGGDLTLPYWFATQFATSDRFYTPAPVQTQVARLWSMAATSQGFVHPVEDTNSHLTATTIFQLLDKASVTWKIYSVDTDPGTGKLITTLRDFQPYGLNQESRIVPIAQFFTDLQNGTLPQFSYIEPSFISGRDEHPGQGTSIQAGADFVGSMIRALINSSSWKDSIFIEAFDEGGGLFDHVGPMIDGQPIQELAAGAGGQAVGAGMYSTDSFAQHVPNPDGIPPQDLKSTDPAGDFTRTGFRVPLIIVSPFAKPNFVSHTPMDTTAVLKLLETRFQLSNLTKRDAAQADMSEFFDFANSPNLNPPAPPTQPTSLPCNPGAAAAALGGPWTPP